MTHFSGAYLGALRCQTIHEESGKKLLTDAPKDNQGKGESFSPTDLVATSLASCMLTIMAIRAQNKKIELGKVSYSIQKVMASNPRRINEIKIDFKLEKGIKEEERAYLEQEAKACPVALSLSQSLKQTISFQYV